MGIILNGISHSGKIKRRSFGPVFMKKMDKIIMGPHHMRVNLYFLSGRRF